MSFPLLSFVFLIADILNRLLSVGRSGTDKIIELSRAARP